MRERSIRRYYEIKADPVKYTKHLQYKNIWRRGDYAEQKAAGNSAA
jgi:hypothetical protein